MMLVHPEWGFKLCIEEGKYNRLAVENGHAFYKYIAELISQCEGCEGDFVLSENGETLELKKHAETITDLFKIDIKKRQLLTAIFKRLGEKAVGEELYTETLELKAHIMRYLAALCEDENSAICVENDDFDMAALFKEARVYCDCGEAPSERLFNYMQAMREYCGKRLFIIIGAGSFFDTDEWNMFIKELTYEKMDAIFIDNKENEQTDHTKDYVIDKDLCEIYED